MAKEVKFFCLVLLAACLLAAVCRADEEDGFMPPLASALGNQIPVADNYDDYPADDDSSNDESDVTKPCCLPTTWQGRLVSEVGFAGGRKPPVASHSVDQVFIDGSKQRVAGNKLGCHGRGRGMNISYILLVGANKTADMYLFNRAKKQCKHRALKGVVWRPQCLPANATMRGTYSLGPLSGGLSVQSWMFHVGGRRAPQIGDRPHPRPRMSLAANILVTSSCIPVVLQEVGSVQRGFDDEEQNEYFDNDIDLLLDRRRTTHKPRPRPRPRGTSFVGSVYYTGIQPKITDPTVFNPPSFCKKYDNTLMFEGDEEDNMPSVLEQFLVL